MNQGSTSTERVLRKKRAAWFPRSTSVRVTGRRPSLLAFGPGAASIAGLASHESTVVVIVAVVVWLLAVVGRFFLQKRRDDVFADTVRQGENKTDIMRAISIYEAVRSRQLTPEAIVRLLKPSETDAMPEKILPGVPDDPESEAANETQIDGAG
jgi:hypothetical protein